MGRNQRKQHSHKDPQTPVDIPKVDLYEILGIPSTATQNEIRSSYRRLSLQYHPDKNPEGGERFKEINRANEILSNEEKRDLYDKFGFDGLRQDHEFSSFLNDESIAARWKKIAIVYFSFIVLNWLFGVPLDSLAMAGLSGWLVYSIGSTAKTIGLGIAAADLLLYFLIPSSFFNYSINFLCYLALLLYGNTVVKMWDYSALMFAVAVLNDFYFQRYPTRWNFINVHSFASSLTLVFLLVIYITLAEVPESENFSSKYVQNALKRLTKMNLDIVALATFGIWTLLFLIDYQFGFCFEMIPLALLGLINILDWKITYALGYILGTVTVWYFVPTWIISGLAQLNVQFVTMLFLFAWVHYEEIKEKRLKYNVKNILRRLPIWFWAIWAYLIFVDFMYRERPTRLSIFASFSLSWGIVSSIGMFVTDFSVLTQPKKKKKKEDKGEKSSEEAQAERQANEFLRKHQQEQFEKYRREYEQQNKNQNQKGNHDNNNNHHTQPTPSTTHENTNEESNVPQTSKKNKSCHLCGNSDKTRKCSGCGKVYYCSVECQKRDRPTHKHDCKPQNS